MDRRIPAKGGITRTGRVRGNGGFSMIELLVVVNIMVYFCWLVVPAVTSILSAQGVGEASYQVSSLVERARNEAVTRQTYVWLALQEEASEGSLGLRAGMVCSKDGTANTNATNLMPLNRPVLIRNVGLTAVGKGTAGEPKGLSPVDLGLLANGLNFRIGKNNFQQGRSITFLPLGEVSVSPTPDTLTGFDPLLGICLRRSHGMSLQPGDDAAVLIDGSTGSPVVYRK